MGRVVKFGRHQQKGLGRPAPRRTPPFRKSRRWRLSMPTFYVSIIAAAALAYVVSSDLDIDLRRQIPWESGQSNKPARPAAQNELIGRASIIDGDTITVAGQSVRFNGIDAPESQQRCTNGSGASYACGRVAANALDKFLAGSRPTRCAFVEWDQYGRFVGDCYRADGESVARWLVRNGHAVDWARYSGGAYAADQAAASEQRIGLWAGEFQPPWEWRAERRNSAVEKAKDTAAPQPLLSTGCNIKGNISKKGARIYHVPGQKYYDRTRIDRSKGERMFCSEAEARKAGWRRSNV